MTATNSMFYTGVSTQAEYFNLPVDAPTIINAGDGTDYVFAYNRADLIFGQGGRDVIV
jgi:hypothetical protein